MARPLSAASVLFIGAMLAALANAQTANPPNPTSPPASANPPISAIWAGEWKAADFNIPPASKTLTTRRDPRTFQVTAAIASAECPMTYDGQVQATDIVKRIEERVEWQLSASNWPAGTEPAQLVGLKKEFDSALRLARSLPPDSYRRVRMACPGPALPQDHFFLLNEGRRLFEFRFPENGLSLGVTLFERVR